MGINIRMTADGINLKGTLRCKNIMGMAMGMMKDDTNQTEMLIYKMHNYHHTTAHLEQRTG
jgi:hypothetical protein